MLSPPGTFAPNAMLDSGDSSKVKVVKGRRELFSAKAAGNNRICHRSVTLLTLTVMNLFI